MLGTGPDILRLLSLPVLAWAAWSDYQVRRVDPRVWPILIALGGLAAIWQITQIAPIDTASDVTTLRHLVVVPPFMAFVGGLLLNANAVGGADAKALFALGILFPAVHLYTLPFVGVTIPQVTGPMNILIVSILINGLVFGVYYALRMWVMNFRRGERSRDMLVSETKTIPQLAGTVGQIIVDDDGDEVAFLDADTLRMYLRWRGVSVDTLETRGAELRDPATIEKTYRVNTGSIDPNPNRLKFLPLPAGTNVSDRPVLATDGGTAGDEWGAERFLADIDHDAYGNDVEDVRRGLDHLASREEVRVRPAYPLIVPLFLGLLAALTVGDLVTLWSMVTVAG